MRLFKRRRKTEYYAKRWKDLQKHCASRKTWAESLSEAESLLNDALKSRNYKGKTTGERLVAAQHELTDNEAVWFSHKLCARVQSEDARKLKKQDIINGLSGYRQALRDLGVLV